MPRTALAAAALVALLTLTACGPSRDGRMTTEAPPADWETTLSEDRERKNREFLDDPGSPLLAADRARDATLAYFPPDPGWRYVGTLQRYPTASRLTVVTTTGGRRPCARVGWVSFVRDGVAHNLQVYRLLDRSDADPADLFLPFADPTNGESTYDAGRYVELERGDDGRWILDFNRAYNPWCAYGDPSRFACPVPPRENRLPIPVTAGERRFDSGVDEGVSETGREGRPPT